MPSGTYDLGVTKRPVPHVFPVELREEAEALVSQVFELRGKLKALGIEVDHRVQADPYVLCSKAWETLGRLVRALG